MAYNHPDYNAYVQRMFNMFKDEQKAKDDVLPPFRNQ